ncbi:TPA: hypothetical protein N2D99_002077 [Clostridium botulinum]|nr:hypothetical protein [Clostridium botulinum]
MEILIKTCIDTLYFTGMIILVGFILGCLRRKTLENFQKSFGWNAIAVTAFIGVPVHELSHALFAIIFKHKITGIKLLQKPDEKGTLGYVNHTYNPLSLYQNIGNFFIGVAPIFGGVGAIVLLMNKLVPTTYQKFIDISLNNLNITVINDIFPPYWKLLKTMFSISNFNNPYYVLFLFLAICIASHISLSSADIEGAKGGLITIYLLLLIINTFGGSKFLAAINIIKYNIIMIDFLTISLIFSIIAYLISFMLVTIKNY